MKNHYLTIANPSESRNGILTFILALVLFAGQTFGQDALPEQAVKGDVRSSDDSQLMAGANVVLKGTSYGTFTDADGHFEFPRKLKEGDILLFSFVGFESGEFVIPKKAEGDVNVQITLKLSTLLGEPLFESTGHKRTLWSRIRKVF